MSMTTRLVARCSDADRQLLIQVAGKLRRTPSNTLRYLIYEKAVAFQLELPEQYEKETDLAPEENIRQ